MPVYEYKCTICEEHMDIEQSFSDEPVKTRAGCKINKSGRHKLKKVFSAVGISFKGDGFYRNDARSGSAKSTSSSNGSSSSSDSSDSASSSDSGDSASSSSDSDSSSSSSDSSSTSKSSSASTTKKSDSGTKSASKAAAAK